MHNGFCRVRFPPHFSKEKTTRWCICDKASTPFAFVAACQGKRMDFRERTKKAPLCKGSCQPNRLTEGLLPPNGRRTPEGTRLHFRPWRKLRFGSV